VLVLAREKKGSGPTVADASPRQPRGPRTAEPAQPEIAAQEAAILNSPPAAVPADQSAAQAQSKVPDAAIQLPSSLQPAPADSSGVTRPGALSPPQSLNQQTISQQLQQMYQQRMMMQPPTNQANPANPVVR